MKHVEVAGVRVSAIGLGCWQFGSRDWGYGKTYGDVTAVELVHTALDLGVNLVDTAEAYARGVSETIVGRALEGRRADAFRDQGDTDPAHRGPRRGARPPFRDALGRRRHRPLWSPLVQARFRSSAARHGG